MAARNSTQLVFMYFTILQAKFSPDFCQLVESCLQRDPTMRPNYDMLLQHPFVVHHEKIETDVEEWFADVMGECG